MEKFDAGLNAKEIFDELKLELLNVTTYLKTHNAEPIHRNLNVST